MRVLHSSGGVGRALLGILTSFRVTFDVMSLLYNHRVILFRRTIIPHIPMRITTILAIFLTFMIYINSMNSVNNFVDDFACFISGP